MGQLLSDVEIIRASTAVAASQTNTTGNMVDTKGYDGAMFILGMGAATATSVITLYAKGAASTSSTAAVTYSVNATVTETTANIADGTNLVLDIYKPRHRYLWPHYSIATANAAIDGCTALLYGAAVKPTTQPASVASSTYATAPTTS